MQQIFQNKTISMSKQVAGNKLCVNVYYGILNEIFKGKKKRKKG